jgi:DNA invertase Pin-like site-specific DNA recombinase
MKIGYARVSTPDQSLEVQREALRDAGVDPAHIYTDKESGTTRERPGFEEALSQLREGDTLVAHRLNRLGRSLHDLVELLDDLDGQGVDLLLIEEGIDTSTPMGRMIYQITGVFAEYVATLNRERTIEGLRKAREEGRTGGRERKIKPEDMPKVSRLMRAPDVSVSDVLALYDVSKATLYQYVGPEGQWRRYQDHKEGQH